MTTAEKSRIIEQGDIFFFYRPKVGTEEICDIEDIQRFYMILAPEEGKYGLFIVGQKKLPEIVEGKTTPEERNWALNILTTDNPEDMRKELLAYEYETERRGKRKVEEAVPVGEGKYAIVKHGGHTELAYVLELPEIPGPAQKEFDIKKEASYIISVKNPDIEIPGFAAFEKRKPQYPSDIKEKFGDRCWINIEDPDILDHENTQLLLIGARQKAVEEELGIELNDEEETANTAELFKALKIRRKKVPLKPLLEGKFPSKKELRQIEPREEVRLWPKDEAPRRAGKAGGKVAATRAPSAAAIAKVLSGADFPMNKEDLVRHAERNRQKVGAAEGIIQIIRVLPDKKYRNMVDVEMAFRKITGHQYTCPVCGQHFDQKSRLERHIETSHPKPAPSATDVERALADIRYPKTKEELMEYASHRISSSEKELLYLIKSLPGGTYMDAAGVAKALGMLKRRESEAA